MRLEQKICLITGGASGIGAATARKFAAEGAKVVIGDIQKSKGQTLADQIGSSAFYVELDVTSEASWRSAMHTAIDRFGRLTSIVNAAGISVPSNVEEETLEGFRRTLSVNLDGTFLGCKLGVEALKNGQGGAIVNVASTLGILATAVYPAYCSSKGAVRMLTRSVALHCAQSRYAIRVNAILPGRINTELLQAQADLAATPSWSREQILHRVGLGAPMGRLGEPSEIASVIAFLASDEASYITGADFAVDGGDLAILNANLSAE